MIALNSTQRSLELDLASASSNALDIVVCFTDIRYSDQSKNAGVTLSVSNGITDVTICAAPSNGVLRIIDSISINNNLNTATETVRVYYDENGTEYDIVQVDAAGGDQIHYEDNEGWKILNSAGQLKSGLGDHGALTGLTDDDHTQYALLAGRATGQTLTGGTASGDDLTLRSTSNATKGDVLLVDDGGNVIIGGAATASRLRMMEASGSGTNYTEFVTQAQAANITYTLPADDGDANQVLSTNGSGTLDWVADSGGFTLGTEQATTAGTAIDFTGIPSGTEMIVISIVGVSTNGTGTDRIQIGDSGGIETTGYLGATGFADIIGIAAANVTDGFNAYNSRDAATTLHGQYILTLEDSTDNTWTCIGIIAASNGAAIAFGAGSKSLTATLDRVRLTTSAGDTFDAGAINITYS